MTHVRGIIDDTGDTVDQLYFCSDSCDIYFDPNNVEVEVLQTTLGMNWKNDIARLEPYGGWNGCHEILTPQKCSNCGTTLYHQPQGGENEPIR